MKVGIAWDFGQPPPEAVPGSLLPVILQTEMQHHGKRWRLTWLEGQPVLSLDDQDIFSTTTQDLDRDDDSWLE